MEQQPEFSREIESPIVTIEGSEGEICLHYLNTLIRTFKDPQFNHVEHRDEEGNLRGLRVPQSLLDTLFEQEFPYRFDPYIDTQTMDWYVRAEVKNLDQELGEI